MKTIYCTIMIQPAVITISDTILDRIRFLEQYLRDWVVPKQETPLDSWDELRVELSCSIGKDNWSETIDEPGVFKTIPKEDGPVLVYGNDTCVDNKMRRVNDSVLVNVSAYGSYMSHMGYEGDEDPIDSKAILDLPDLFFSEDIVRSGANIFAPREIDLKHLMEDMPEDHLAIYRQLIEEHRIKYGSKIVEDMNMSENKECQENDSEGSALSESS